MDFWRGNLNPPDDEHGGDFCDDDDSKNGHLERRLESYFDTLFLHPLILGVYQKQKAFSSSRKSLKEFRKQGKHVSTPHQLFAYLENENMFHMKTSKCLPSSDRNWKPFDHNYCTMIVIKQQSRFFIVAELGLASLKIVLLIFCSLALCTLQCAGLRLIAQKRMCKICNCTKLVCVIICF